MFFGIIAVIVLLFLGVLKIAKGILKLILILILVGLLIGTFAGRDHIESTAPSTTTTL